MIKITNNFSKKSKVILHKGDTADFIKTIPENSIKLIITSPPYNVGKSYEKRQDINKYLEWHKPLIKEMVRILHPEGSLCWQVGNYVKKGEIYPLDIYYYEFFKSLGLKLRNRIIWHFGHGLHAKKRFSGRYETLLWFTKEDKYTFNLDPVRVPSKYPNKKYFKGKKKGLLSGNPLGKNPSDFWNVIYDDWEKAVWEIPNVKNNHPEKTIHPCQFPVELVERCVLALTNESDYIYDPYAGVGSALIAGLKHNRKVIGSEKEEEYVEITKDRIKSFLNGNLKLRPLGKPIYDPSKKN
ncbi:MAG: site-specific DNA-methyltransferase [Candidatus Aenigmarchaeota archaeon]|nr:site-specific DNA-methyltransferase [Candidatus Aenigmarchaeota archaeon]